MFLRAPERSGLYGREHRSAAKARRMAALVALAPPGGGLAQLGEHLLCKQGVIGSIPIVSTIVGSDVVSRLCKGCWSCILFDCGEESVFGAIFAPPRAWGVWFDPFFVS